MKLLLLEGFCMTEKEEVEFLVKTMRLSNEEAKNAAKFIKTHKNCTTESRSFNNVKYTITFSETAMGSFVKIQCEKCHKEKDISDDIRCNW